MHALTDKGSQGKGIRNVNEGGGGGGGGKDDHVDDDADGVGHKALLSPFLDTDSLTHSSCALSLPFTIFRRPEDDREPLSGLLFATFNKANNKIKDVHIGFDGGEIGRREENDVMMREELGFF